MNRNYTNNIPRNNPEEANRTDVRQSASGFEPMMNGFSEPERTIDLVALFYYMLSKLYLIIIGAVLVAIAFGIYGKSTSYPIYRATSKMYIIGNSENSIVADLQIGTVLTKDYQEVFKTWEVHQMVNEYLGTDFPYSYLQGSLVVENPEDTRILYLTVYNEDPQLAADIANAYVIAAKQFIAQTMDADEPSTFSVALVPTYSISRSIKSWVIRGFVLGSLFVAALLVLLFLLDNRPKTPEDIMKYAGIPTLTVIPVDTTKAKHRRRKGKVT